MKKMTVISMVFLAVVFLAGCPVDSTVDGCVPNKEMGMIAIEGHLYEDAGQKAGIYDIREALKRQVVAIEVYFYNQDGRLLESHNISVVDGQFAKEVEILPGNYQIQATYLDRFGKVVFSSNVVSVNVLAGSNSTVELIARMVETYNFQFEIVGLPVEHGDFASANVFIDRNYNNDFRCGFPVNETGQISPDLISASLPMDFAGGLLEIVSKSETYQYQLSFSILDVYDTEDGVLRFEWSANVGFDLGFEDSYIYSGGKYWISIQSAVDNIPSPVHIELGDGDYAGFTLLADKSVTIVGLGAGRTRIVDNNPGHENVIKVAAWASGNQVVALHDLQVYSGFNKPNHLYRHAAVFIETGSLEMRNCVVVSKSNDGLATNYCRNVTIDHCVFNGSKGSDNKAISIYCGNANVSNSIILFWDIGFHSVHGGINTQYNCVDSVDCCFSSGGTQSWSILGFVFDDPRVWVESYVLLPDSPCIGAANDGVDIGLLYSSVD